jgi:hypothetical protein
MTESLPPAPPLPEPPPASPPSAPAGSPIVRVLLCLAGMAAPVAGGIALAWVLSMVPLGGNGTFGALLAAECVFALAGLAMVARRRARWFWIPFATVSAGITLLCATCWTLISKF